MGDSTLWWLSEALPGKPQAGHPSPTPSDPSRGTRVSLARPACLPAGLFGTGIQSYFTFLRFLLLLNLLTLGLTASVVLLPLAWLRPPGPGPAQNLSEYWRGSLIFRAHLGMPPVPSLDYLCPAFAWHTSDAGSARVGARLKGSLLPCHETPASWSLSFLNSPAVPWQPPAPHWHSKIPQSTLEYFNWQGKCSQPGHGPGVLRGACPHPRSLGF